MVTKSMTLAAVPATFTFTSLATPTPAPVPVEPESRPAPGLNYAHVWAIRSLLRVEVRK